MILREDVRLTVGGVVQFMNGHAYLHPECLRELMGEEAYQELLSRPRIICEYDYEENQ